MQPCGIVSEEAAAVDRDGEFESRIDAGGDTCEIVKGWCYQYLVVALVFDTFAVFALFYQNEILTQLLLGVAAGSATVLGIHVAHHISDENEGH